jgi:8-oxo-dGTP pyrophosphatase MutT (NUDIX family)
VSETPRPNAKGAPAPLRDAATVVLLQDADGGPAIYLVQRSRKSDFMGGAHVFPGGRFDPSDAAPSACALLGSDIAMLKERLGEDLPAARAAGLFVAAVRETFEEAGLLLGRLAPGWNFGDARRAVADGAQFTTLVASLDAQSLVPWVRWVTPEVSPKRFDARFFLARSPAGQEPSVDGHEATEGLWITPREALRRWEAGEMLLPPATAKSIDLLIDYATVDEALAAAAKRPPPMVMPSVRNDAGRAYIDTPESLGGSFHRIRLEEGRYRPIK